MNVLDPHTITRHGKRAIERCLALSRISEMDGGILRQYLTVKHAEANQQAARWMQQAGMTTWQDEVGNQWGRLASSDPAAKRLIVGSHLDTVPNAGAYDGILGVMLAIELADLAHQQSVELPFHLDVVGFCDEEGTRFGATLIGSKALAGDFNANWLELTDEHGTTMADAMTVFGLDPLKVQDAALDPTELLAYWETHIEQGPVLEAQQQAIGVVTAIAGAKRALVSFKGRAGHSGTTPMHMRQDSLVAAAEFICKVEQSAAQCSNSQVATVGYIDAKPGAVNVIAGKTTLSLDVRAQQDSELDQLLHSIEHHAQAIAEQRNLTLEWQWTHAAAAVACDQHIMQTFMEACARNDESIALLPSGAGHDAMAIATKCPVGMLFVRSPGGVSHHPSETVVEEDVARVLAVMYSALAIQIAKTQETYEPVTHDDVALAAG
ncbi:allantoate amidohydrolase [Alteromonas sp. ASW11-36]|uniref:Allantoate amidohydrolase n=1 Tax=Alteromonas arenosi TaxID=3055817 RepID=A0ABT7SYS0_9ALTE|nr:allantoate amidohydrolase [Alteromonas sp. ASW11-36]MDM7861339.1 allantoate amidohydrolase [Alteromonas sp. ASW11-36]